MLLSGNVLAFAVELTAALVAEVFAEYLLLNVYRATFTAAARTWVRVRQKQRSKNSRLNNMRIASKQQITAREPNIGMSKKSNVDKTETETDHLIQKYYTTTHQHHK